MSGRACSAFSVTSVLAFAPAPLPVSSGRKAGHTNGGPFRSEDLVFQGELRGKSQATSRGMGRGIISSEIDQPFWHPHPQPDFSDALAACTGVLAARFWSRAFYRNERVELSICSHSTGWILDAALRAV